MEFGSTNAPLYSSYWVFPYWHVTFEMTGYFNSEINDDTISKTVLFYESLRYPAMTILLEELRCYKVYSHLLK